MSKHFSIFQTESQFNAAAATLDFPHVSLIDTTGELKYAVYNGKSIADADYGDIVIASVTDNSMINIKPSEYNLTEYPLANYKPIAVCIFPASAHSAGNAVFLSVQYSTETGSGARNYYEDDLNEDYDLISIPYNNSNVDTEAIRNYTDLIYSESATSLQIKNALSLFDKTDYPLFATADLYHTPGTSAG